MNVTFGMAVAGLREELSTLVRHAGSTLDDLSARGVSGALGRIESTARFAEGSSSMIRTLASAAGWPARGTNEYAIAREAIASAGRGVSAIRHGADFNPGSALTAGVAQLRSSIHWLDVLTGVAPRPPVLPL